MQLVSGTHPQSSYMTRSSEELGLFFLLVLLSMRSGNKDWKCSACSFVPNWDMLASWNSETMNNKWAAPVPLHLGCWPWLWGSGKTTVFWQKLGLVSAVIPRRDSNISSYWILAFSMWGSKNQLHLGPLDFDPDLGYVSYFWGIDSANNHSHISKSHPLNNTDTLGGRFPWPVTLSKCNWFLEHTPNLHIWRALPRSWDSFFCSFCYQCGLEIRIGSAVRALSYQTGTC